MRFLYWLLGLDSPGTIQHVHSIGWYAASPIRIWLVVVLALLGVGVAAINLLPQNIMPFRTRVGLLIARVLGFGLLLVLTSQLEVRLDVQQVVRPKIAVLTDTSGSMGLNDVDGAIRIAAARAFAQSKLASLADRADVSAIDFSWQLHTADRTNAASSTQPATRSTTQNSSVNDSTRPDGMTRLMACIQEAVERERDLQSLIVLTDGNDTTGDSGALLSTVLSSRKLPVFPVVFGKEGEPKMASVKISATTPYVRLGDEFRLSATLAISNLRDQVVGVRVYELGNTQPIVSRDNLRIGRDPVNVSFVVKPQSIGMKTYRITMEGVKESVTSRTLETEQTVQVLNNRVKVLYLDIPRDERKILGHWLARDPIVDLAELTLLPKGGWYAQGVMLHQNAGDGLPNREEDLYKYDVIILGDIPRSYFRAGGDIAETKMQRLIEFVTRRGGGLITLGGRSAYAAGQYGDSALARILPFETAAAKETQVSKPFKIAPTPAGLSNPVMMLEADPAANREAWLDLPSLDGNNFVGNVKPGAALLAVRTLESGGMMPVIAMQPVGKGQVLSLSADTTWRWEMMRPEDGDDYFRRFWGNVIRALAPDPRVAPNRPQIIRHETNTPVGQTITLSTRLVDSVYKPVRDADLDVKVTSPSGKVTHIYPRDGRESPGLYEYEVMLNEPGSWEIAAAYKDQVSTEYLVAGESASELDDPRAKPQAMAVFAKATGGESFTPEQGEELMRRLDLSPKFSSEVTTVGIWDLPIVMIFFVTLVCIDCLVRKRRGMV